MAKKTTAKKTPEKKQKGPKLEKQDNWLTRQVKRTRWWFWRGAIWAASITIFAVLLYIIVDPPTTWTMRSEKARIGEVDYQWIDIDEVAPVFLRSVVAAEDANFCLHWGFDVAAIRAALDEGGRRGASTLTQQTVKNAYLWQGRSWIRKSIETLLTPLIEIAWTKRRILEIYVNIAEFDEGVFGVDAAAHHYFGVEPADLSALQAARLAAVLPAPKTRSASKPNSVVRNRAAAIMDGAATIRKDRRSTCFED
ncbi:monofunctional biosynthetic peptidoglycan transglycosylase [Shimia thalassica]|uniref:monofunctional biosynthetic peptidoglycan transglycosylase n=1 Tax=Shimia thalassica TaxID=1715693 RepID=UPI002761BEC9|nr:monofunctional biosynthetic peptidoglycan transglycosylase [Shimia thalassica]